MSGKNSRATMLAAVAVGAVGGLAWTAALRAYMSEISGLASTVDWAGTFLGILLPGLIVGACLGSAASMPMSTDHRTTLRWLAVSPLLLAIAPLLMPSALIDLLTQGLGSGAIGVVLGGIAGGYAIGGEGAAARASAGVVSLLVTMGIASSVPLIGGADLSITTARGAWIAVLAASLMVSLCIACSLPFRKLTKLRQITMKPVRKKLTAH
ncbi:MULTISPECIES: hypothetical protein [Microbacterium]|uniref:hypothetical protein n=1 Tax=Microbacterium TaxID=33882 RepID=UPI0013A590E8|nr:MULTISPECIES: hypothetical protein [Microbacterium]